MKKDTTIKNLLEMLSTDYYATISILNLKGSISFPCVLLWIDFAEGGGS